jgi:PKD repeat protein
VEILHLPSKNKTATLVLLVFSALIIQTALTTTTRANPTTFVNLSTDKELYKVGDEVKITGNVTVEGVPVYDALVALQVNLPQPYNSPFLLRTAQTGQILDTNWRVNITQLYACNAQGNPLNNFTRGTTAYTKIKWKNNGNTPAYAVLALYIQYSTGAPCKAYFPNGENPQAIPAQIEETLLASFEIPPTAPYGTTTIYANMYTNTPKEEGYPYCPERNATFMIMTPNPNPPPETQTPPNFRIKFSLDMATPGGYNVYAATSYQGSQVSNTLAFPVLPNAVPPKADFIYSPSTVGVNLTTTFDGSPSLPEGYNDTITRYAWNFGDGTPLVVVNGTYDNPPNPRVNHVFTQNQTYTVTLNVTDNEALWNTTSKTICVNLVIPPTADFLWNPQLPINGTIVTFDGGISQWGWNGTARPPITNYQWDFGDGYTTAVTTPTTNHVYENPGTYIVTLTVTDAGGVQDSVSKNVTVYPPPPGGSPDLDGDGRVTMGDVVIVLEAFGSTPGKPHWNPIADIDRNDRVDMTDVMIVIDNFGKSV